MPWSLAYWLLRRLVGLLARGDDGRRGLESAVLRYQIKVLSRQRSRQLRLRTRDRAVLAAAALFLPPGPMVLLPGGPRHATPLASAVRSPATASPPRQARETIAQLGDLHPGGAPGA